nr:uncharacterized protein LOC109174808 isoform X1 [Ipomoea batatas]
MGKIKWRCLIRQKHEEGGEDYVVLQLYWGIAVNQTPFELQYTLPPSHGICIHRQSSLSDIVNVIRSSMDEWQSSLVLTGRLPVSTDNTTFTVIPFPIVSDESWQYFVNHSSRFGELHIYVITAQPQSTNTGFMGLQSEIMQHVDSPDGENVPHDIRTEGQQIYTDYSRYYYYYYYYNITST